MIKINVKNGEEVACLSAYRGERIDEVLRKGGISISQPCGGKGTCGKCKVKVSDKAYPYLENDLKLLGEENIKEGFRILCKMRAIKDIDIELNYNKKFDIVDSFEDKYNSYLGNNDGLGICVDLGTTTIAVNLIRLSDGMILNKSSRINSQNKFGADVISRIEASQNGKGEELKKTVISDILFCINEISNTYDKTEIKKIIIAGNTAMTYLMLGKSCEKIAKYPFECDFNEVKEFGYYDIFSDNSFECKIYVVNCLSAFVGGDIVSGGVFCRLQDNKNSLFIDLGTNAEMAVFNGENLYITSAAAGPAFEGGNIRFGVGGIDGAICKAEIKNNIWSYETIGKAKACGICGSGLIDIIAVMLENKIMDKNGLLSEKYFDEGVKIGREIFVTQNDIRQFQLAKAAIRAGIKILIQKARIKPDEIKNVFIAGGFGFKINTNNAFLAGLFPNEFYGKLKAVGNSSLGGLRDILLNDEEEYINKMKNLCVDINLAEISEFNDLFMEEMSF